ncbi:hypothetical protein, partial [Escherichia coli]|uniref:hypothetical protein n=1 Tax=Escherichia coli TaxID=562 RepID=UPI00050AB8CB
ELQLYNDDRQALFSERITDNHPIHRKYMHMQIDTSDNRQKITQQRVLPTDIYIQKMREKRTRL